jgi:hypothetical protein
VPEQPGWAYQHALAQSGPPRSGGHRFGMPVWLLGVIGGFLTAIVALFVAAVAIPVFINQHAKAEWQATTVTLPASIAGHDRLTGRDAKSVIKAMVSDSVTAKDIGIYGTVGPDVIIVIAMKSEDPMSSQRQEAERAEFTKGFGEGFGEGKALTMKHEDDSGKLGGWFGCGSATAEMHVCLATDKSSMFSVIMGPGITNSTQIGLRAREATVSRSD